MQWPLADFLFEACFEYEAEWIVEFTCVIPILLLVCFFLREKKVKRRGNFWILKYQLKVLMVHTVGIKNCSCVTWGHESGKTQLFSYGIIVNLCLLYIWISN